MTAAKRSLTVVVGVVMAVLLAFAFSALAPQAAQAKTITTKGYYVFYGGTVSKVASKKIVFKGIGYKGTKTLKSGTYTFKRNAKTKFVQVVNSETGATKAMSKSKGAKTLKSNAFISARVKVAGGVAKEVSFGAW